MIERLIENGHAYEAEAMCCSRSLEPDDGHLSGRSTMNVRGRAD